MNLSVPGESFSLPSWELRRLWNQWNMLKLNVQAFYDASCAVGGLIGLFLATPGSFAGKSPGCDAKDLLINKNIPDGKIFCEQIVEKIMILRSSLEILSSSMTIYSVDRLLDYIKENMILNLNEMLSYMHDVDMRLRDELGSRKLLVVSATDGALFELPYSPMNQDIFEKFPSHAVFEIDEAAKCLALERHTASAFHSIRCLEVAIRALYRCLGSRLDHIQ